MFVRWSSLALLATLLLTSVASGAVTCTPANTVTAQIAALDQPLMLNRYGASLPQGQIFALVSDLVPISGTTLSPGNVRLRPDKRPRPLVLRVPQKFCLQVTLFNYLGPSNSALGTFQPATNEASFHVNGLNPVKTIADDGTLAGANTPMSGILCNTLNAGCTTTSMTYTLYAAEQGTFFAHTMAARNGDCNNCGGQLTVGLFGSVNVEPPGAEVYRSQVSQSDFSYAASGPAGQLPKVNYIARYPANYTPPAGSSAPKACWPVLAMVAQPAVPYGNQCQTQTGPLVTYYSDLTAIITGPNQGNFTGDGPEFDPVSALPNRRFPFREFNIHYHELESAVQAFPDYYYSSATGMTGAIGSVQDQFSINYGTAGIGTEIMANRMNVGANAGPQGSTQAACVECKFEEFFLTSWAVGDPAMVVNIPANSGSGAAPDQPNVVSSTSLALTNCALNQNAATCTAPAIPTPKTGRKATQAFFPDDPSNVYHSYLDDHVTFRILHAGPEFTHVHHQHAHQWLHTPNSQDGSYLDSQLISPGSAFTLEMVYGGGGNRNKTTGDSIFHCHFYPHFAAGMWSLWRVHDVFEGGTLLNNGVPASGARALPDGEIPFGTPIPAIVPLPTYAMAPLPAPTKIVPSCASTVTPCPPQDVVGYVAQTLPVNGVIGNPGYPFFVPGVAGHRPPRPPLDIACSVPNDPATCMDGGLQRHVILQGTITNQQINQWDFSKDNFAKLTNPISIWNPATCPMGTTQPGFTAPATWPSGCVNGCINAMQLPEGGTVVEKAAMSFMGIRNHSSVTPTGVPAMYVTNGLPKGPQPGAPYADPAIDDNGAPVGTMRRYKAAVIQTDVAFNKAGWHYPQQRYELLWDDVQSAVNGGSSTYTPQPLFFRANSLTDFVEFWHMNLVPSYYELDDYQVRTPTDILGQHIHLVKFDVLASDGAANGFNYEDGTLSPDEVRDRIGAIRNWNACTSNDPRNGTFACPVPKAPPINVNPPAGQCWLGAQVTIQRWYADPLLGCVDGRNAPCNRQADRTLRTVFTHDHFGPSTHQQTGLYAGLLVEPTGSTWTDPITGVPLGSNSGRPNSDGGPTSWQSIISATQQNPGYREFAIEFQDLTHAYLTSASTLYQAKDYVPYAQGPITAAGPRAWGWADCANVINGGNKGPKGAPCPLDLNNLAPTVIDSGQQIGTMSVNYRNEPLPLRVQPATGTPPAGASPWASDLGHVYSSLIRNQNYLNVQPTGCLNGSAPPCTSNFKFPPQFPGAQGTDPYTPLLQAYQGDNVQIRVLVGAHFFNHNFGMQGIKWLFEPSNGSSGWRDNQGMGISEHFEYLFNVPSTPASAVTPPGGVLPFADYLYTPGSGIGDQGHGLWGLLRAYTTGGNPAKVMPNLKTAPGNPNGGNSYSSGNICGTANKTYYVAAISPQNTSINYNTRPNTGGPIQNTQPILYVPTNANGAMPATMPTAPLVLRANAGDCVDVVLFNLFDTTNTVFTTADTNINGAYPLNQSSTFPLMPSTFAGIHAQMVTTNASTANGVNVGFNLQMYGDTAVPPGKRAATIAWA